MNPIIPNGIVSRGCSQPTIKKGVFSMYIVKQCPMCRSFSFVYLNDRDCAAYLKDKDTKLIQDILPNIPVLIRETLLSGYCVECQSILFCSNFVEDE